MSPEQNDFQDLRRLLALKRHEQPPPAYFDGFSQQVMSRIRAGQHLENEPLAARVLARVPWLQQFWAVLQAKPSVAGAFGVLVCGLLISVVLYSEHSDAGRLAMVPTAAEESAPQEKPLLASQFSAGGDSSAGFSSMSGLPTAPKSDSLFEEIRHTPQWRLQSGLQATPQPVVDRIPLGP